MPGAGAYNGVYRAQVVQPPAGFTGLWVVVPRINGDEPMGPCDAIGSGAFLYGDRVMVTTVAGLKDDLVVLGKVGAGSATAH